MCAAPCIRGFSTSQSTPRSKERRRIRRRRWSPINSGTKPFWLPTPTGRRQAGTTTRGSKGRDAMPSDQKRLSEVLRHIKEIKAGDYPAIVGRDDQYRIVDRPWKEVAEPSKLAILQDSVDWS